MEVGAFGKETYILTGYFNLPKVLELTLHNGVDPRTGKQLGPQTGDAAALRYVRRLLRRLSHASCSYFIDIKIRGNNVIERLYADLDARAVPLAADRRLHRTGRDYHDGGARYNTSYIQGVGLGTMTDA